MVIISIWLVILLFLSLSGFLADFSTFPPRMGIVLLVPMVSLIWFISSKHADVVISRIPADWIVKLQGFRVVVELFIWWAYLDSSLPVQMTFEGRNFDILVGLTAPLVALWWLKSDQERSRYVLIWNIFGLLLLFNIVIVAVLSMPTPKQIFFNQPDNTLVAGFPWVLLPGILVALAFGLHLISIKQMLKMMKS